MKKPIPKAEKLTFFKQQIFEGLNAIDFSEDSRARILAIENTFRTRIDVHLASLPLLNSDFRKFNTSPFVVMFYAAQHKMSRVNQIENAILPAKVFSSMETSAGRMVEEIMLPQYGWETVPSSMHTSNSCLDGKKVENDSLKLVTLKSGPRCLNDEMSENFADAIKDNLVNWAEENNRNHIDFTYGVLYGTQKQSNKKDWHILRKLCEKIKPDQISLSPSNRWNCSIKIGSVTSDINIRIGYDWWTYLAGDLGLLELCIALVRACIPSGQFYTNCKQDEYSIENLMKQVSIPDELNDFNISLLQKEQLPWLLFVLIHFCDYLE